MCIVTTINDVMATIGMASANTSTSFSDILSKCCYLVDYSHIITSSRSMANPVYRQGSPESIPHVEHHFLGYTPLEIISLVYPLEMGSAGESIFHSFSVINFKIVFTILRIPALSYQIIFWM